MREQKTNEISGRDAMDNKAGDRALSSGQDSNPKAFQSKLTLTRAQHRVQAYLQPLGSLSDELIRERRDEAAKD